MSILEFSSHNNSLEPIVNSNYDYMIRNEVSLGVLIKHCTVKNFKKKYFGDGYFFIFHFTKFRKKN